MQANLCPEHAREIILDWLAPWTDSGGMDALVRSVADQLTPYAIIAARRALHQQMGPDAEVVLIEVRGFLGQILQVVESISVNPDLVAIGLESSREILEAEVKLRDWIRFLDTRHAPSEVTVPPAADVIFARGDVP